jgi:hypothetical protein
MSHFGDERSLRNWTQGDEDILSKAAGTYWDEHYNVFVVGDGIEPSYPETWIFPSAPVKGLVASRSLFIASNMPRASVKGVSGVYEIVFQSGKRYVGKAYDLSVRAWKSADCQSKKQKDPAVQINVHPKPKAYKDNNALYGWENKLLGKDKGGHNNPNNYNERAVPGY